MSVLVARMNLGFVSSLLMIASVCLLDFVVLVNGAPLKSRPETRQLKYAEKMNEKRSSENGEAEAGRYFEGDLAISEELIATRYGPDADIQTAGLPYGEMMLWPSATVYYNIDDALSQTAVDHIHLAMKVWSDNTCVKFSPRTSQPDYVHITTGSPGCYSNHVGYSGTRQKINLQESGCTYPGTIAHELGHIMGLWHEQSRPDRDKYVKIMMENVKEGDKLNFKKAPEDLVDTHGLPYDYDSVMHYSSNAFSKNGEDTIEVIHGMVYEDEGAPVIGQRDHLSMGDVAIINKMYNCQKREIV